MHHPSSVRHLAVLAAALLAACDSPKPPPPQPAPQPVVVAPVPVVTPPPAKPAPAQPAMRNTADADLAAKVKAALAATPGLQSFNMDVTASDGEVSLFGTAPNRATRDKAGAEAAKIEGVKSVKNNLAIVAGS